MEEKLNKIKEHEQAIEDIKREIEQERKRKLYDLPQLVGLNSVDELISALKDLASTPRKGRAGISGEIRVKMKDDLKSGMKGTDVAKKYGVSVPTVQKLKQELGLVKTRS